MQLVEKTIIKKSHLNYQELDQLSFHSKNLYNAALYTVRQEFFKTGKFITACQLFTLFKNSNQADYIALPRKVSMQVLFQVDQNFRSFFNALKEWKINSGKFNGRPKIPKYKHKTEGRNVLIYDKQAIGKRDLKKTNCLHLSGTKVFLFSQKVNWENLAQVQIVPRYGHYVAYAVYNVPEPEVKLSNNKVAAIDLGVNILAAMTFSDGANPELINGRPLKSINQFYNKKKGKLQSYLPENKYTSNKIEKLTTKRNNKVNDYLHKVSRYIVNQLVSKNITFLIIGYNEGWKQETNLGQPNNQNFTSIPFLKFVEMLRYKCRLMGIQVETINESYTSKCSFLDLEELKHQEKYAGKRIHRGLFRSAKGFKIQADINGSWNIMRKAVPELVNGLIEQQGIEGIAVYPVSLTTYKR